MTAWEDHGLKPTFFELATDARRERSAAVGDYLRSLIVRIAAALKLSAADRDWRKRRRQGIRALRALDNHMLRDMGLSRDDIRAAAAGHLQHRFERGDGAYTDREAAAIAGVER